MSIQERISPISSNYTTSPASSPETVTEAKGVYVGELQEKWQFPSDHLPIGLTYKYLNFASWNVLDSSLMHWVTVQNSQGLSRSLIAKQHYYVGGSGVTFRELRIINDIHYMLFDNSLPRSLIALQECSYPFLQALKDKLPSYIDLISTSKGECILLNKYSFQILNCMELSGVFPTTPRKTIQEIWIRSIHRNMNFRIINAHLPGDPNNLNSGF